MKIVIKRRVLILVFCLGLFLFFAAGLRVWFLRRDVSFIVKKKANQYAAYVEDKVKQQLAVNESIFDSVSAITLKNQEDMPFIKKMVEDVVLREISRYGEFAEMQIYILVDGELFSGGRFFRYSVGDNSINYQPITEFDQKNSLKKTSFVEYEYDDRYMGGAIVANRIMQAGTKIEMVLISYLDIELACRIMHQGQKIFFKDSDLGFLAYDGFLMDGYRGGKMYIGDSNEEDFIKTFQHITEGYSYGYWGESFLRKIYGYNYFVPVNIDGKNNICSIYISEKQGALLRDKSYYLVSVVVIFLLLLIVFSAVWWLFRKEDVFLIRKWLSSLNGMVVYINRNGEIVNVYQQDVVTNKTEIVRNLPDHIGVENINFLKRKTKHFFDTRRSQGFVLSWYARYKTSIFLAQSFAPVYDENILIWLLQDVSESFKNFSRYEDMFKIIFNNNKDIYCLIDQSGMLLESNKKFSSVFSLDDIDLNNTKIFDLMDQKEAFYFRDHMMQLNSSKRSFSMEQVLRPDNKKDKYINWHILSDPDNKKDSVFLFCIGVDVTYAKEQEKKLLKTQTAMSLIRNNYEIGLWEYDYQTGEVFLDTHSCTILGTKQNSADYKKGYAAKLEKLIHPIEKNVVDDIFKDALLQEKGRIEQIVRFRLPAGDYRWVKIKGDLVRKSEGSEQFVFKGILLDYTEVETKVNNSDSSDNYFKDILFVNKNVWVWKTDSKGDVLFLSENVKAITGYSQEEMMGDDITKYIMSEDKEKSLFSTEVERKSFSYADSNGLEKMHIVTVMPIYEQNKLVGHLGSCEDVTEKISEEKKQDQQRMLLETFMNSAPDMMTFKDTKGVYITCNREFAENLGMEIADVVGKTDKDLFPIEYAKRCISEDNYILQRCEICRFFDSFQPVLGEDFFIERHKSPCIDKDGTIIGVVEIIRNMSDIREIQNELEAFNKMLQMGIEALQRALSVSTYFREAIYDGLGILGEIVQGDRVYILPRVFDNSVQGMVLNCEFEWCREGVDSWIIGENEKIIIYEESSEIVDNFYNRKPVNSYTSDLLDSLGMSLQAKGINSILWVPIYQQDKFWGVIGIDTVKPRPLWSKNEVLLINLLGGVFVEILRRKQLEDALRERTDKLVEARNEIRVLAEKADIANNAKTDFLANMSHEIRTPLNGINSMSLLLNKSKLNSIQKEYLDVIIKSGDSLMFIINDILDYSKIESHKLEIIKEDNFLMGVIYEEILLMQPTIAKKYLKLYFFYDQKLPVDFVFDAVRIRQMVRNLISNAIKFTQEGYIYISVSGEKVVNEWNMKISIQDTGLGIKEDVKDKIFSRFEQAEPTTTKRFGGTGLGLSIVKNLAEIMGGSVSVESIYNQGSTFSINIPLAPAKQKHGSFNLEKLENKQICIVSEDTVLIDIVSSYIAYNNIRVSVSLNITDLKNNIQLKKIAPDVILLDESNCNYTATEIKDLKDSLGLKIICMIPFFKMQDYEQLLLEDNIVVMKNVFTWHHLFNAFLGESSKALISKDKDVNRYKDILSDVKILAAEDNEANTIVLQELFSYFGASVDIVGNGAEALSNINRNPDYDIILMDCHMPVMDGYEAAERIRALGGKYLDIPIVAMSADIMGNIQGKFKASGFTEFLAKPFNPDQIVDTILNVLSSDKKKENITPKYIDIDESGDNTSTLNVFNYNQIDALSFGDKSLGHRILESFRSDITDLVFSLEQEVIKLNFPKMAELAHTIKGSAANVGAEILSAMSIAVEHAAKEEDIKKCGEDMKKLSKAFIAFKEESDRVLNEKQL